VFLSIRRGLLYFVPVRGESQEIDGAPRRPCE
jgi:hypothetical protein